MSETGQRMDDQQAARPHLEPALALLEFGSIAVGMQAADAMVKRAPIDTLRSGTVHNGKYLVLIGGQVADLGISAVNIDSPCASSASPSCWTGMMEDSLCGPGDSSSERRSASNGIGSSIAGYPVTRTEVGLVLGSVTFRKPSAYTAAMRAGSTDPGMATAVSNSP